MDIMIMKQEHIGQIAALEAACFSAPWSEKSVESELTNPLSLWLVAVDGDVVAGYVGSQTVMGEADMMNLAVGQAYRRQGIGRRLVEELVRHLRSAGTHSLTLEVRASNDPAIALYNNMGFLQVGKRPNYYSSPKEDALILRKEWDV